MGRVMYDSVTVGAIPAGASLVAGYVDGRYANADRMHTRLPHATVVRITVLGSTLDAHVVDIETGDCTPKSGVAWAKRKIAVGQHPTLYMNASTWPAVKREVHNAGLDGKVSYWVAQYDSHPIIPAGAVAKQYVDHGPHGENIDVSVVADYWPGVDPAPKPHPTPTPLTVPLWWHRDLREGMSGVDVLACKRRMTRLGYRGLSLSPSFGRALTNAVKVLQGQHRLPVTGVVDRATAHAIRTSSR